MTQQRIGSRESRDPQVKRLYELLRAVPPRGEGRLTVTGLRQGLEGLTLLFRRDPGQAERETAIRIPGRDANLSALLFHPGEAEHPPPILVYLHGGGWVGWGPESHAPLARELCSGVGALVVSVEYRLAPEHPYPTPLEDCVAVFRHVCSHAAELGGDPRRVALAGDSAGGNLSAATTLRLLANGEPPPAAVALLCPGTDAALDTDSYRELAPHDLLLSTEVLGFFRDAYVRPEQWGDPFVSPLRGDLRDFPPTCVVIAGLDPLHDDGQRFAERLRAAGREVELLDYPEMPHEFMLFAGIDTGASCIEAISAFLRGHLDGKPERS